MDLKVYPSKLRGSLPAVSSKSDVHRALICAAFSDGPTDIRCNLFSKDIEATMRCLNAAGAEIRWEKEKNSLHVEPVFGRWKKGQEEKQKEKKAEEPMAELFCEESGSTLRFLLPVMAAAGLFCRFTGGGELPKRPLSELISVLRAHGAKICGEQLPLILETQEKSRKCPLTSASFWKDQETEGTEQGEKQSREGLLGGSFSLPGNISSQYITGLLLSFPLLGEDARIHLTSELESKAYVDMTIDTMRRFGVPVLRLPDGYGVKETGPASLHPYVSPGSYQSDGDWSNAAFWLTADRFSGNQIRVEGLRENSLQGDRKIAEILNRKGSSVEIDASGIPDLVPILSAFFSLQEGCTARILHGERLRLKECDRLRATAKLLAAAGAEVAELPDGLIIRGKQKLWGGAVVSGENDHRIVMTAAILATACENPLTIQGTEAVEKSYPHFFQDLKALGGRFEKALG